VRKDAIAEEINFEISVLSFRQSASIFNAPLLGISERGGESDGEDEEAKRSHRKSDLINGDRPLARQISGDRDQIGVGQSTIKNQLFGNAASPWLGVDVVITNHEACVLN